MNKRAFLKQILFVNAVVSSIVILSPKYRWEISAWDKNNNLIIAKDFTTDVPSWVKDRDIVEMENIYEECKTLGYSQKDVVMKYGEESK